MSVKLLEQLKLFLMDSAEGGGRLSLILLSYFSAERLPLLVQNIRGLLSAEGIPFELIIMDDGSSDSSYDVALSLEAEYEEVRAYALSRNFTSHYSAFAGLTVAKGDCIALIPDDDQQPLELLVTMYRHWQRGAQVIFPFREKREENWLQLQIVKFFYKLINWGSEVEIPPLGMDTWFIDREPADVLIHSVSHIRTTTISEILRLGFSPVFVPYVRKRSDAKSRWTLKKKLRLAADWLFSTSTFLLDFMIYFGVLFFVGSLSLVGLYGYARLFGNDEFWGLSQNPGWVSIVCLLLLTVGLMMICFSIIGQYLLRIFDETKGRPAYIIRQKGSKSS